MFTHFPLAAYVRHLLRRYLGVILSFPSDQKPATEAPVQIQFSRYAVQSVARKDPCSFSSVNLDESALFRIDKFCGCHGIDQRPQPSVDRRENVSLHTALLFQYSDNLICELYIDRTSCSYPEMIINRLP